MADRDLPTLVRGKHESANMRMKPKQLIELRHASLAPRICRGKSDASFWQTTTSPDTRFNTSASERIRRMQVACLLAWIDGYDRCEEIRGGKWGKRWWNRHFYPVFVRWNAINSNVLYIYIYLFRSIVLSVYFSVMIFFKNNLQRYLQLCFIENCNGIISDTMDTFLKY